MKRLALLPLALLAACNQPRPTLILPPLDLTSCADAPAVPELPPKGTPERDQATVNLWLDERKAGADCRSRVKGLAAWRKEAAK